MREGTSGSAEVVSRFGGSKRQRRLISASLEPLTRNADMDVMVNNCENSRVVSMMDVDTDNDSWNTGSNSSSVNSNYNRSDMIITDSVDTTFSDGFSLLPVARVESENVTTVSTWLAPR